MSFTCNPPRYITFPIHSLHTLALSLLADWLCGLGRGFVVSSGDVFSLAVASGVGGLRRVDRLSAEPAAAADSGSGSGSSCVAFLFGISLGLLAVNCLTCRTCGLMPTSFTPLENKRAVM